jgi:hypothetical protein
MVSPLGEIGGEALGGPGELRKLFPHLGGGFGMLCNNFDTHLGPVDGTLVSFEHHHSAFDSTQVCHG